MMAVSRSCVSVPIVPPVVMIFVEASDDASVITTCARDIGMRHVAKRKKGGRRPGFGLARPWLPCIPELSDRSPRIRSIPTMSPGLSCASSGDGAAVPPAIMDMPQAAAPC